MEKLRPGDPQTIGAYRLLARLGAGGMGQVYLARSDRGRTVAVKLVRQELAEIEEFRDRFRLEVQAARQVGGAWTAPVLDADTEAPVPWVATGYVAGPSLHSVISGEHGPLAERSVRVLGSGLAHALVDIHAAGLIHRDLKPSNVLVTIDGPRVIDFGIARALETMTDGGLTRTGALVGSPGFMAPEQVRGDRVGAACDVFCLGSVLAYAATGKLPFVTSGSGVHALMFRIAQEPPDLTGLPESLQELVGECLRKDPAARPTPAEILERTDQPAAGEPWLPGPLVAQLGRHAVRLLDTEDPGGQPEPETGAEAVTDGGAPEPVPARPIHAAPTAIAAPRATHTPPPTPLPGTAGTPAYGPAAPPAYGHPQPGYGYPPQPAPEPARRSGCSTFALVLVALIVAVGAGGGVYAVMGGTDSKDTSATSTTDPGQPAGGGASRSPGGAGASADAPTGTAAGGTSGRGAVPDAFIGTWNGSATTASGTDPRRLVIRRGEVGDTVLSLTADGGDYHCVFEAELAGTGSAGAPLEIGPSTVTAGEPMSSCNAGGATELILLPDGRLRRVNTSSGDALTYTKAG
ncbi:serine/threonine-protein kinase [Streptomyces sp. NBC_00344]|uniref:serine/threonine-protein kinase n=1 Tax=Streptomyces sp. NBC_00344 TaxID=2975720 RepID=UPI002E1B7228